MSADVRLADEQSKLVAALTHGQPSLPGFDATRLHAMSVLLRAKRRRAVARSCPAVARGLGARFVASFDEYAVGTPLESDDAPIDDAVHFLQWLRARGQLPRELRLLALRLWLRARWRLR